MGEDVVCAMAIRRHGIPKRRPDNSISEHRSSGKRKHRGRSKTFFGHGLVLINEARTSALMLHGGEAVNLIA